MNLFTPLKAVYLVSLLLMTHSQLLFAGDIKQYTGEQNFNFVLSDLKGQTHALIDYRGKTILLNFWASWCPPCIYEMPELKKLQQRFKDKNFQVVTINAGEKKQQVRKFSQMMELEFPVLLDKYNKSFNHWDVKTLPTSYLINEEGKLVYIIRGNPGWEDEVVLKIIEQQLPEKQ